ncbi:MAG TPA: PTS mannitol transporter subunit IICBA [Lactobacillaceae bacterium]|jgi:PTS system mannitol-specific IIC component
MQARPKVSLKTRAQNFGSKLSGMVMPNIGAFIAWGLITALFIPTGWLPNETFAKLVTPMITYMLPLLIGFTGGSMVYEHRGGVVGAVATIGVIVGTDIPMFLGAMAMGPLGGYLIKKVDAYLQPKTRQGFEMLVNNFSAGILAAILAGLGLIGVGPLVEALSSFLAAGVNIAEQTHLLPLANIFIEPAKILFLNNAINQGILTPLGVQQAAEAGKSMLFLLEPNPGPGLGILLAYMFFGKGASRASAPGAAIIHFFGGIHEIYFPYVLAKPALFLAVIGGGVTGSTIFNLFGAGLKASPSPGSIIAVTAMLPKDHFLSNAFAVYGGILAATAVSFAIAAFVLSRDKSEIDLAAAQTQTANMKAESKGQVLPNVEGATATNSYQDLSNIKQVIFACEAGMGSSAMGASLLRDKVKKAGLSLPVTNTAIRNLKADENTLVVTQNELAGLATDKAPTATRVSVDNFLSAPEYDEIIMALQAEKFSGDSTTQTSTDDTSIKDKKLTDVLSKDAIAINQKAATKEEAIRLAGDLLVKNGAAEPGYIDSMIERDAQLSIYMGNFVAIPHGTDDGKKFIKKTAMSYVQIPEGVNFGAAGEEEKTVTAVFGIAGLNNEHLDVLSKIAVFASDVTNIEKLTEAKSIEEVLALLEG